MEDYGTIPPFIIIIQLELSFVQIVGLGSLLLSVTNSEEKKPGRDCDTGSESRLEQHPPLDTPPDPQIPLVGKSGTWVAADSGQHIAVSAGRHGSFTFIASYFANAGDVIILLGSYIIIAKIVMLYGNASVIILHDSFAMAEVCFLLCSAAIAEGVILGRVAINGGFSIIAIIKNLLLFLAQQSSQAGRCQA